MPSRLESGLLIVVEGIDGAGKTTQARRLHELLSGAGLDVVLSKEPTDGPWGQKIRTSAAEGRMSLEDELHAFVEDRRQHVAEVIRPALERGAVVIIDRYYYSTAAYQSVRGADARELVMLNETFAPRPHLLFLIDVPADVGLSRVEVRDGEGNEFEQLEDLNASRNVFLYFADEWDAVRIDGTQEIDAVSGIIDDRVLSALVDRLPASDVWTATAPVSGTALAVQKAFAS